MKFVTPRLIVRVILQTIMFTILRFILRPFVKRRFNVHYHMPREVRRIFRKGAIVMPMHTMSWDPILISGGFLSGIHWVATEALFRKTFLRIFMKTWCGCIPKTKNRSDMEMLTLLRGYLKLKRSVGIFPEGQQTWDGAGLPAVQGTAKLVRFLKVPVVFVKTEGGFLSKPRWTKKTHPNRMDISYEVGISAEEIQTMKLSDIKDRIASFLDYNDYEMQKERQLPLRSEIRAEGMEISLFACPQCKKLGTLRSSGNLLRCEACGYEAHVDQYGFFEDRGQKPHLSTPVEWNRWQQQELKNYLASIPQDQPLLEEKQIRLLTSRKRRPLVEVAQGDVILDREKIIFKASQGESREFELKSMTGLNVFKQQSLEFYYSQVLYRFQFTLSHSSAYKWMSLYSLLGQEQ